MITKIPLINKHLLFFIGDLQWLFDYLYGERASIAVMKEYINTYYIKQRSCIYDEIIPIERRKLYSKTIAAPFDEYFSVGGEMVRMFLDAEPEYTEGNEIFLANDFREYHPMTGGKFLIFRIAGLRFRNQETPGN